MVVGVGRFGPYIRHNSKFVSLPKGVDPLEIELEEAIVLIEAKEQKDREKLILSFEEEPELQVLNGRYGPYITYQRELQDSERREAGGADTGRVPFDH